MTDSEDDVLEFKWDKNDSLNFKRSPKASTSSNKKHRNDRIISSESEEELSNSDCDESERCAICLGRIRGKVGSPDSVGCDHYFCLLCILEWAKNNASCPQDRRHFNKIIVRKSIGGSILEKVPIEVKKEENNYGIVEENPTYCEVCGSCEREDCLLLCDGCDLGYHLECLTPPLSEVPIEEWFCPLCVAQDIPQAVSQASSALEAESKDREVARNKRVTDEILQRTVNRRSGLRRIPRTRETERILQRITRERKKERKRKRKKRKRKSRNNEEDSARFDQYFKKARPFGTIGDDDIDAAFNNDDYADQLLSSKIDDRPLKKTIIASDVFNNRISVPSINYAGRTLHPKLNETNTTKVSDILTDILSNQNVLLSKSSDVVITSDRSISLKNDSKLVDFSFMEKDNSIMSIPLPSQRKATDEETFNKSKDRKNSSTSISSQRRSKSPNNLDRNQRSHSRKYESSVKRKEEDNYHSSFRRRSRSRDRHQIRDRSYHRRSDALRDSKNHRSRSRDRKRSRYRSSRSRSKDRTKGRSPRRRNSRSKSPRRRNSKSPKRHNINSKSQSPKRRKSRSRSPRRRMSKSRSPDKLRHKSRENSRRHSRLSSRSPDRVVHSMSKAKSAWSNSYYSESFKTQSNDVFEHSLHSMGLPCQNLNKGSNLNHSPIEIGSPPSSEKQFDPSTKKEKFKNTFMENGTCGSPPKNPPSNIKLLTNEFVDEYTSKVSSGDKDNDRTEESATDTKIKALFGDETKGQESPYDPCNVGFDSPVSPCSEGSLFDLQHITQDSPYDPALAGMDSPENIPINSGDSPYDPDTAGIDSPYNPASTGINSSPYDPDQALDSSPISPVGSSSPFSTLYSPADNNCQTSLNDLSKSTNSFAEDSNDITKLSEKNRQFILSSLKESSMKIDSPPTSKPEKKRRNDKKKSFVLEDSSLFVDAFESSPAKMVNVDSEELIRSKLKKIDENINKDTAVTNQAIYDRLFNPSKFINPVGSSSKNLSGDTKKKEEVGIKIKEIKDKEADINTMIVKKPELNFDEIGLKRHAEPIKPNKAVSAPTVVAAAADSKVSLSKTDRIELEAKVVKEATKYLYPYYQDRCFTKQIYKQIMEKIVRKVLERERSMSIKGEKIQKLVDGYVQLHLHQLKKKNKK